MSWKVWLWYKQRYIENLLTEVLSRPWSDLRGISNSYAAKSTVLIPLIGCWVIFNESVVRWLNLAREFVGAPASDHISPRVLWLYLALCAIALGSLIYAKWCPLEVKKYGDWDYVNGDGPPMSKSTMHDIEQHIERAGYVLDGAINKADYLQLNFQELDESRRWGRWAVTVCFAFGSGVMAALSGEVFWKVIALLYQGPFGA